MININLFVLGADFIVMIAETMLFMSLWLGCRFGHGFTKLLSYIMSYVMMEIVYLIKLPFSI